jgi:hypothetical protein
MSLRIPGALPPAAPMVRRDEPSRRSTASTGNAPNPARPAGAAGGAVAAARSTAVEPTEDQWVRSGEASTAPAAPAGPTAAPEGAVAYGAVATGTDAATGEAMLAAERVRQDVLARPAQAGGVHGSLVAATVLNLLA